MNKQMRKALRDAGFTGKFDDADALKAWLDENPMEFVSKGKTLTTDDVVREVKTVTVTIAADAGEDVRVEDGSPEGEMEDDPDKMDDEPKPEKGRKVAAILASGKAPGGFRSNEGIARKIYERKIRTRGVGAGDNQAMYGDVDQAEAAGAWFRYASFRGIDYPQKSRDLEIITKAHLTTTMTLGGALVPDEFRAELIEVFQRFGAHRQVVNVASAGSDVAMYPRLTSDAAASWSTENSAATDADAGFDQVEVVARKLICVSSVTNELMNDSAISVADIMTRSQGRSIAGKEEDAYFNGDGTSTYGGITGIIPKMTGLGTNPEDAAGLHLAAGDTWLEITGNDINDTIGLFYEWDGAGQPVFVCHSKFFWQVLVRFIDRVEATNTARGANANPAAAPPMSVFGFPVILANKMPTASTGTTARDTVPLLFGDFNLGSKAHEVAGGLTVATSEHVDFRTDRVAIRSTNRFGATIHDVGDTTTPGPIVGLIMEDA
jgi:HK97 family phage major capsid protein